MADVRGACAIYYSYQVLGADGRIKVPFRRRTGYSFVRAFGVLLYLRMGFTSNQSTNDTGNVSRTFTAGITPASDTTSGTSTSGLVVGTGTTAVDITDVALVTQIAHGASAAQLQYGASVVDLPSSDSTSTTLILTRPFSNASGGSITVREIGMYCSVSDSVGTGRFLCLARDLATIALSNGDVLTLNYILKTTA